MNPARQNGTPIFQENDAIFDGLSDLGLRESPKVGARSRSGLPDPLRFFTTAPVTDGFCSTTGAAGTRWYRSAVAQ